MPPEASGVGGYEKGVITEGQDGATCVRLRVPLTRAMAEADPPEEGSSGQVEGSESSGGDTEAAGLPADGVTAEPGQEANGESNPVDDVLPVAAKRTMNELGLLHLLWTNTRLNRWHPNMRGKRSWSLVGWVVTKSAQHMKAGRTWLSSILVVVPPARPERRDKVRTDVHSALKRVVERTERERVPRVLVLAEVSGLQRAGEEGLLQLVHGEHYGIRLVSKRLQLINLERRFPDAKRVLAQRAAGGGHPDTRVIGLFAVEPAQTEGGWELVYVSGGLMVATWDFLPYSSSYERDVLDRLVEAERAFEKPMRFEAGERLVFPDFVLCDTAAAVPMEVYGRQDLNQPARLEMRESLYPRLFPGAAPWEWVIDESDDPPAFPKRVEVEVEASPGEGIQPDKAAALSEPAP